MLQCRLTGVFVFNLGLLAKVLSPSQDLLSVKLVESKQRPAAPLSIHGPVSRVAQLPPLR